MPNPAKRHVQVRPWGFPDSGVRRTHGGINTSVGLVQILPLVSAALWFFVGLGAFGRYGLTSPFVRALALFCVLVSAWALVDYFLGLNVLASEPARLLLDLRESILIVASLVILLASKWISRGHSRYDILLGIPVIVSLTAVLIGMTGDVTFVSGDPVRYLLFVATPLAYFLAAASFALTLITGRLDLPPRLRGPALWSIGGLIVFVILWLATNVFTNLTQGQGLPLFSSVLSIPAVMEAIAFARRTPKEMGEIFRAVSQVERRVIGLYVFYRTGEPLVAVGASRTLPIEAEQLEGILNIVGNFVETSMRQFRGYTTTSMNFDRLGILAVRGEFVIVAAVFEGPAYDALRSELRRSMQAFEATHRAELATWEGASRIADVVADDLAALIRHPESRPA
jgi:hypothetical protein